MSPLNFHFSTICFDLSNCDIPLFFLQWLMPIPLPAHIVLLVGMFDQVSIFGHIQLGNPSYLDADIYPGYSLQLHQDSQAWRGFCEKVSHILPEIVRSAHWPQNSCTVKDLSGEGASQMGLAVLEDASVGRRRLWNTRTHYGFPVRRLMRLRNRPRCSIAQFLDILLEDRSQHGVGSGRQLGECEIHVDGVLLYRAFGALAAGLAYLTYQAIKGNPLFQLRRRKREEAVSLRDQIELILLGRLSLCLDVMVIMFLNGPLVFANLHTASRQSISLSHGKIFSISASTRVKILRGSE